MELILVSPAGIKAAASRAAKALRFQPVFVRVVLVFFNCFSLLITFSLITDGYQAEMVNFIVWNMTVSCVDWIVPFCELLLAIGQSAEKLRPKGGIKRSGSVKIAIREKLYLLKD